jgi:hypothetical protein
MKEPPKSGLSKRQISLVIAVCAILLLVALISSTTSSNENSVLLPATTVQQQQPEQQQQQTEIISAPFQYSPRIRYEPSSFEPGQKFSPGTTPLSLIDSKQATAPIFPRDWDGGYGWIFVKYHPSPFERQWAEKAKRLERKPEDPLCGLFTGVFQNQMEAYLRELPRMTPDDPREKMKQALHQNEMSGSTTDPFSKCRNKRTRWPEEPMKFDDEIFSKFEYVYNCTRPPCWTPPSPFGPKIGDTKFSYIEPLVGLLRHPLTCSKFEKYYISKNYLLVDPWPLVHVSRSTISPQNPKVIISDLGSSTWREGLGGASQSWFYGVYESLCLAFTDWFMFESTELDPAQVMHQLPGRVKSGYRWFNIPLKTEILSWDNPLNHLLVEAKKEDIVIVKIDFDTPLVEMELLQTILKYPEVAELIDELYFEHHVNVDLMKLHWNTRNLDVYQSESIKLFTSLREIGIRAHSWV